MRAKLSKEAPLVPEVVTAAADVRGTNPVGRNRLPVSPAIGGVFYLFTFSILFEGLPLGIPLEPTSLLGGLLILVALLQPQVCFRYFPAPLWFFAGYLYVGVVSLVIQNGLLKEDVIPRLFVLVQLLIMFWIAYNLLLYEQVARNALLSLAASCALLAVLDYLGLAPRSPRLYETSLRFMPGLDPNLVAGILGLGLLSLVGLTYGVNRSLIKRRLLIWPVFLLIGPVLVRTGSRGGLLALGLGLSVFTLKKGPPSVKLRNFLIVLLGLCLIAWIVSQSEITRHRIERTLATGEVASRDSIYLGAWEMFLEKPMLGWGPVINTIELGERMQVPYERRMDAHNLILYVLTASGLLGGMFFFTGTWLCVRSAWRARRSVHGVLPFALTVSVLISDMSVSGLHYKPHWFVMAYALASGSYLTLMKVRPGLAMASRPSGRASHSHFRAVSCRKVRPFQP
jgi:hypothetical protein